MGCAGAISIFCTDCNWFSYFKGLFCLKQRRLNQLMYQLLSLEVLQCTILLRVCQGSKSDRNGKTRKPIPPLSLLSFQLLESFFYLQLSSTNYSGRFEVIRYQYFLLILDIILTSLSGGWNHIYLFSDCCNLRYFWCISINKPKKLSSLF